MDKAKDVLAKAKENARRAMQNSEAIEVGTRERGVNHNEIENLKSQTKAIETQCNSNHASLRKSSHSNAWRSDSRKYWGGCRMRSTTTEEP
eukprot:3936378-Rhodomonas_salina.2